MKKVVESVGEQIEVKRYERSCDLRCTQVQNLNGFQLSGYTAIL